MDLISSIHNDLHKGALQLIAEHRARLYAEALGLCKNETDAEDLVIRTLDKAIRKIDTYSGSGDILSWMRSIMTNLHLNDNRAPVDRMTKVLEAETLEEYAEATNCTIDEVLRNSDSEVLHAALDHLDPEYKKVLVMHYFGELPVKNIALALNIPLGTVLWRLSVARRMLAKSLGPKLGKKPFAVLAAILLGVTTLFGAAVWGVVKAVNSTGPFASEGPLGSEETLGSLGSEGTLGMSADPVDPNPDPIVSNVTNPDPIVPKDPIPAEQISTTENTQKEETMNLKTITKTTAKLAVGAALAIGSVSPAWATWRYVSAEDPDNAYDGVAYITDGNWAIKVSAWNATNFTTPMGGGWLAGEGVMDLTTINTDLGKTWSFVGKWTYDYTGPFYGFSTLTEIILPETCTSICDGMFKGCSNLTKLTILSERITYIGHFAFYNCSKLAEVSPEFVLSGECSEYGKSCFGECRAMHIPMKWKLEGGISMWHQAFWNTGITSWDVSEVMGSVTGYNGLGNNSVTNSVWGPNMTTFIKFGSEKIIRFTGGVPTTTFDNNRSYRIYGDPAMDANWRGSTVAGVDFAKPTAEQRAAVAEAFGAADAANLIGVSSKNVYLIKWISPYRKGGMKIIFK